MSSDVIEDPTKPLAGRIALITGASRGLGQALAPVFAEAGAHLILVARSQGGLEETDDAVRAVGGTATLVPLDLNQSDAIDFLGASVYDRWEKLDILIGAAGILGELAPVSHISPKAWQASLDINLTANWRLIRSFDALLRQSDAGRVIMVSSSAVASQRAFWAGYAAAKAALETLTVCYAKELEKTSVRANIVRPGKMRTRMRAEAAPVEDPATLTPPEAIAPRFLDLALPSCTSNGEIFDFST